MSLHRSVRILVVFAIGLTVVCAMHAQASYTAQVRGTITDPTGAVIPNAEVTITNSATNIAASTHTNEHDQSLPE